MFLRTTKQINTYQRVCYQKYENKTLKRTKGSIWDLTKRPPLPLRISVDC